MSARTLIYESPCLDHGLKGNSFGYASVRRDVDWAKSDGVNRKPKVLLHRWVFWNQHGYLPDVVMHACDNTRCIEPSHLLPGDQAANNRDRADKGRSAPWVPARQKLTAEAVLDIRHRMSIRLKRDPDNGPLALSREYGVDINVIYQIASGRTYRNVA